MNDTVNRILQSATTDAGGAILSFSIGAIQLASDVTLSCIVGRIVLRFLPVSCLRGAAGVRGLREDAKGLCVPGKIFSWSAVDQRPEFFLRGRVHCNISHPGN